MVKRRSFLCFAAVSSFAFAGAAAQAKRERGTPALLREAADVAMPALRSDRAVDQGRAFQRMLDAAARARMPVVLPPGDFQVSGIDLPEGTHLSGTAGATRLLHGGGGPFLSARSLDRLTLRDLLLDGQGLPLGEEMQGLLDLRGIGALRLEDCMVTGSAKHGVHAERCAGAITGNRLSQAAGVGLYALDNAQLDIAANTVSDCGNGGILVHRTREEADGTMVRANRILRIAARDGGTGQNGNGINLFRAANVMVTDNHVSDCAFSAIRANAATDVQITGNQCLRSGETAIYAEFGFQGALVSANLIDGAANGILIVNFDVGGRLATVSGNIVRNLRRDGPYLHDGAGFGLGIAAEADTVISGNVIENAPKWGLMLGWGPYMRGLAATGNLVRGCGAGCAVTVVEGAGAALIADNLFDDTESGAILGCRWNEPVTGDLARPGAQAFPHLTIAGNRAG